ncbi:MAG: hypothetical protein AB1540_03870 [Bdellovibrionota bacterium]
MLLKKRLCPIVALVFFSLTQSCAPQRAQFTLTQGNRTHAPSYELAATNMGACGLSFQNAASAEDERPPNTSALSSLIPSGKLELEISPEQEEQLKALLDQIDSNPVALQPGMFREFERTNPATGETEKLCQGVLAVDPSHAVVQTRYADSDMIFRPKKLRLGSLDPIESAVRFIENKDSKSLYETLWGFLLLYYESARILPKPDIKVRIRRAHYAEQNTTFRLALTIHLNEQPEIDPVAVEVRFAPSRPRPFHVIYKAWGVKRATQVLLQTSDSGR